ncbi:AMP-binding enzyme family protein [Mycobacterium xenopi 4042]|uniref:AMP-binding enzyme family protein n=1 Tax=Mycobacterium xenopi 4042 TaxID=1299334 RepID=X8AP13_MYCXE|nr:AMP-binding enzyme family protein [Mycobacterium xenopi 4042]
MNLEGFVPFPADRAARYRSAGYWTGRTVGSILTEAARCWPDRPAVLDGRGRRLSFAELDARADRAAAGLRALGIAPGDRVLLQLPNTTEFTVALFGLLRAGAIPVMCLPGHRAAEIGHFAVVSKARALLIADAANGFDYRAMARSVVRDHPTLQHVVVDGEPGSSSRGHRCAAHPRRPRPCPQRTRGLRRCCWFRAARPGCPNSSPAPTTITCTTRRPAPRSAGCPPMTSTWWCCRRPTTSRWPAPACWER